MPTFGELRKVILVEANTPNDHFKFIRLGENYAKFWDAINEAEYKHGYTPDYTKPGTPALYEMNLLTEFEFKLWLEKFRSFNQPPKETPITTLANETKAKKGPPPPIILPKKESRKNKRKRKPRKLGLQKLLKNGFTLRKALETIRRRIRRRKRKKITYCRKWRNKNNRSEKFEEYILHEAECKKCATASKKEYSDDMKKLINSMHPFT